MEQCIKSNKGIPFKGVIHIGGHRAEEAEAYAKAGVRNVIWVEANKNLMKHIYDNARKFPLNSKYFCAVISDTDNEEVNLNIANNGQSSSILELGTHKELHPQVHYVDKVKSYTKRFDTLWRENSNDINIDLYDFINLDIQGAELKALKGFGNLFELANFKAVYTEINFEEVYKGCALAHELDDFLDTKGFHRILTSGEVDAWQDALYVKI